MALAFAGKAAFAYYASQVVGVSLPTQCRVDLASFSHARFDQAPILASSGYLLQQPCPPDLDAMVTAWIAGLQRLAARRPFTLDRQSFAYRPYEVVGVCIGASRCSAPSETIAFLRSVTSQLLTGGGLALWGRLLAAYAGLFVGNPWPPGLAWNVQNCELADLALLQWMGSHAQTARHIALDEVAGRQIASSLMENALIQPTIGFDIGQTAIVHNSLWMVIRASIGSSLTASWQPGNSLFETIRVVENICRRFPLLARQLQRRHDERSTLDIQDEYDVQDLLHALLVLHFDDVRPEEWTPSYAGTSTRMDFLLKEEKVVIETKMARKGLSQKKVIEELAVDKMRYRSHPELQGLSVFRI